MIFLSTSSARRTTAQSGKTSSRYLYFYPRPPRGGRHRAKRPCPSPKGHFYPRPPRGGRHGQWPYYAETFAISIHVLREEDDRVRKTPNRELWDFYPRPPRGGRRLLSWKSSWIRWNFYPRPPRGGRLCRFPPAARCREFLSTSSARRTTHWACIALTLWLFLSTSSARRTTTS